MTFEPHRPGWRLLFWWVLVYTVISAMILAGTVGWPLTSPLLLFLHVVALAWIMQQFFVRRQVSRASKRLLASVLAFAVIAAVVLATGVLLFIFFFAGGPFFGPTRIDVVWALYLYLAGLGALFGAVIGVMQWLLLRRQVSRASWWVLGNIVAFAAGFEVLITIGQRAAKVVETAVCDAGLAECGTGFFSDTVGLMSLPAFVGVYGLLPGALVGAVVGIITGVVLVWLLRHPDPVT